MTAPEGQQPPVPAVGHNVLIERPSDETPVWRYVNLPTFFQFLRGIAFVPSVRKLRELDPTEGLGPIECEVWWAGCFSEPERTALWGWVRENCVTEGERAQWDQDPRSAGPLIQKRVFDAYYDFLERTRHAWCWFESQTESAAMWEMYGKRGVAVRSTVGAVLGCLRKHGQEALAGRVVYGHRNQCGFTGVYKDRKGAVSFSWGDEEIGPLVRRPYFVKQMAYQHEHEIRFVTTDDRGLDVIRLEGLEVQDWILQVLLWPGFRRREAEALIAAATGVNPALRNSISRSDLFERDPQASECLAELMDELGTGLVSKRTRWPEFLRAP